MKLIVFDLDGTLLTRKKQITERTVRALTKAAEQGILTVPATGRAFNGIPQPLRDLPFLRYAILVNGAQAYDAKTDTVLYKAEIPNAQALEIMRYLDTLPVLYDCFIEGKEYMTRSMRERISEVVADPNFVDLLQKTRKPVDDLKTFVRENGHDAQKVQFVTAVPSLRLELLAHLQDRFENITTSSSWPVNVEVNTKTATKGQALQALCAQLHIPMSEVAAFGDASNDLDMLRVAGVSVAMQNAEDAVKAEADLIAPDCDEDGVATMLEQML